MLGVLIASDPAAGAAAAGITAAGRAEDEPSVADADVVIAHPKPITPYTLNP
jgi:phosphoglycolate phosphatase-like HAD superfamily hydrolase